MENNLTRSANKIKEIFLNINNKIDILIPYYNQQGYLVNLVESIIKYTKNIEYNIYLINDGSSSSDDLRFFFKNYNKHIKILDIAKNSGFGAAINFGLRNSFEKLKVILHSDCLVNNYTWLPSLYLSYMDLNKNFGCELVCSKTNYSGTKFDILESKSLEECKNNNVVLDLPYIPFYSAIFSINLISKIGFFKEYPFLGYEDEEFCARLNQANIKIGLSNSSYIKHLGGKTISALISKNSAIKNIIKKNRDLCKNDIKSLLVKNNN